MQTFYFLFDPGPCFPQFWDSGYALGFIVLFFCSLIVSAFFYLVLGRTSGKYATYGKWFLYMFINMLLVFILSLVLIAYRVFDVVDGLRDIENCVWIFSVLNGTVYAILFYLIISLILNSLSKHSRYIPFNLFKK